MIRVWARAAIDSQFDARVIFQLSLTPSTPLWVEGQQA